MWREIKFARLRFKVLTALNIKMAALMESPNQIFCLPAVYNRTCPIYFPQSHILYLAQVVTVQKLIRQMALGCGKPWQLYSTIRHYHLNLNHRRFKKKLDRQVTEVSSNSKSGASIGLVVATYRLCSSLACNWLTTETTKRQRSLILCDNIGH